MNIYLNNISVKRNAGTIALAAFIVLAQQWPSVGAHSWLECTNYSISTNQCNGYQRGWSPNHIDVDMTYRILNRQNVPACFPGRQDSSTQYAPAFPMANARPGQTLTLTYLENGHVTKDKLPDQPNPKTYTIHWSSAANQDTIKMMSDMTAQNQLGPALPFDDGQCSEDGLQPGRVKRPCRGSFTIPSSATPGRHQFVWWWKFDKAGPEEYTACFDVMILDGSNPEATVNAAIPESTVGSNVALDSKDLSNSSSAKSSSPATTSRPIASNTSGILSCKGQPYNPSLYVCDNNQLCPLSTKACGTACYSPKQYKCCPNNQLVQLIHSC
ncbi:hypothetical protein BDF19DRAFT_440943 [Syncephalis fuscata]|nr:hypothetical protein BDF19DRAFT_440943 [Syncephalis fuscata]